MAAAAYDGIFLAPESIVIYPGFSAAHLDCCAVIDMAGICVERGIEPEAHPGRPACEE